MELKQACSAADFSTHGCDLVGERQSPSFLFCFLFSSSSVLLFCSHVADFSHRQERISMRGLTQQSRPAAALGQNQGDVCERTACIGCSVLCPLTAFGPHRGGRSCWPACLGHCRAIALLCKLSCASILRLASLQNRRRRGICPLCLPVVTFSKTIGPAFNERGNICVPGLSLLLQEDIGQHKYSKYANWKWTFLKYNSEVSETCHGTFKNYLQNFEHILTNISGDRS